ncbi:MAG: hypothetical protein A3E87_03515 [Gammaproteobacteria bacterium RIFCSPHIGHO2_12_FULL_35_23]|nr:MAG: hypothetical protein A3E87_03515 [Gammaproteobacteria bacterium RIFCSPHIGHO2_12_FULL_35_23]
MMHNTKRIDLIRQKLQNALNPTLLEIADESYLHKGHIGAKSGAGHFALTITASQLNNLSKVAAHQLIYSALADMIPTEIHALKIKIQS